MRTKSVRSVPAAEIPMTPMIDIVFLLLVFFLLSVKPIDVLAHLGVSRPSSAPGPAISALQLEVRADGFALNGRTLAAPALARALNRMGELDPKQTVLLKTAAASPHAQLIQALDLCAQARLTNLSVLSVR